MTGEPIVVNTTMQVVGWTFDNFKQWVEHEALFFTECGPTADDHARRETHGAAYVMSRTGPGYGGFPTVVVQTMILRAADGPIPPIDSPQWEVKK